MVLAAFTKFEKVQCLVTLKVFKLVWLAFSEKKSIGFGKMTVETATVALCDYSSDSHSVEKR